MVLNQNDQIVYQFNTWLKSINKYIDQYIYQYLECNWYFHVWKCERNGITGVSIERICAEYTHIYV